MLWARRGAEKGLESWLTREEDGDDAEEDVGAAHDELSVWCNVRCAWTWKVMKISNL